MSQQYPLPIRIRVTRVHLPDPAVPSLSDWAELARKLFHHEKYWKKRQRKQHTVVQIQNYCYIFRKTRNKSRWSSFLNLTTRPIPVKHKDISQKQRQGRHCRGTIISAQSLAAQGKHLSCSSACRTGKAVPWEPTAPMHQGLLGGSAHQPLLERRQDGTRVVTQKSSFYIFTRIIYAIGIQQTMTATCITLLWFCIT